jgi:hypothetical protein
MRRHHSPPHFAPTTLSQRPATAAASARQDSVGATGVGVSMVPGGDQTRRFLGALHGSAPAGSLVEVRFRLGAGMGQRFLPSERLARVADRIASLAASTDVFVGVVARARRGGGRRDLIERAAVVWVDCDDPASVAALANFRPLPTMVVASSVSKRHAYWLLDQPVAIEELERVNHRVAVALNADLRCGDGARIMRAPGTRNHKRAPATPVELLAHRPAARYTLNELTAGLADPQPANARHVAVRRAPLGDAVDARLRAIPAAEYVRTLTGRTADRAGKICCPFHPDERPSLQLYPGGTFYCFGCGVGGSIYDFAAALWLPGHPGGRGLRGEYFTQVRLRLAALLDNGMLRS